MRKLLGILLAIGVLGAGCTPADERDRPTMGPPSLPTVNKVWQTRLEPIGQPVVTGDVAVVIVRVPTDKLNIVGLDTRTGRVRWKHPFSPGDITAGFATEPVMAEADGGREYVVFQRPDKLTGDNPWSDPLVAVSPKTGNIAFRSRPMDVTSWLTACPSGTDVCLQEGNNEHWKLDLDQLRLGRWEDLPVDAYYLGDRGLYVVGSTSSQVLGRLQSGSPLWEVPLASIFGPSRSTNGGWRLVPSSRTQSYWGSVDWNVTPAFIDNMWATRTEQTPVSPGAAGWDMRTGRVLWQRAQMEILGCDLGQTEQLRVRCGHFARLKKYHPGRSLRYDVTEFRIEGFNARDGGTTWRKTVPSSRIKAWVKHAGNVEGPELNLLLRAGWRLVTITNGSERRPAEGEVFVCSGDSVEYRFVHSWGGDFDRTGGTLRFPCNVKGKRVSARPTPSALRGGSVKAGRLWLMATKKGVVAHEIRK